LFQPISKKPLDFSSGFFYAMNFWLSPPTMIDVVCAVIEDSEGRFLACLRPRGKHLAGFWEFPGGKLNPGESPQVALARELHEELSIHAEIGLALDPVIWSYDNTTIRLMPFLCKIISGEPQPLEHERLLWCAPGEFLSLSWADADIPILRQLSSRGFVTRPKLTSSSQVIV
jgi:8-oxo-dGTP diphosphatase